MRTTFPCYSSAFRATIALLVSRAVHRPRKVSSKHIPSSSSPSASASRDNSLASFHPAIACCWITASTNKMLQPQHVTPSCRKIVWWRCPSCAHEHYKRVDLHVAAGGSCPKCQRMPTLSLSSRRGLNKSAAVVDDEGSVPIVKHRCRPNNALATLAAPNANRVKNSIADDGYLRVVETRNLLPMLARNYEKEVDRIPNDETLYVSPKLDGVRCVVAWDARVRRPCFFSRSGMLFECCDQHIEPAFLPLFEKDPSLVFDGELYNHHVEDFEQLVSAIRTTRERCTPETAKLQAKLQYHAFDLLYAKKLPNMESVPFSTRFNYLSQIIAPIAGSKDSRNGKYVQLVPAIPVLKADVPEALRLSLLDGYEGIMVRRDGNQSVKKSSSTTSSGKKNGALVGYAYGARSPYLLKHKVMQDDEYIIVSGVEGNGKWKGCLGAFVCRTKGGHVFSVSPATTEENKRNMWRRLKEYKGKALTVQYQELSANGVPRFPIGKCVRGAKDGKDWI